MNKAKTPPSLPNYHEWTLQYSFMHSPIYTFDGVFLAVHLGLYVHQEVGRKNKPFIGNKAQLK